MSEYYYYYYYYFSGYVCVCVCVRSLGHICYVIEVIALLGSAGTFVEGGGRERWNFPTR